MNSLRTKQMVISKLEKLEDKGQRQTDETWGRTNRLESCKERKFLSFWLSAGNVIHNHTCSWILIDRVVLDPSFSLSFLFWKRNFSIDLPGHTALNRNGQRFFFLERKTWSVKVKLEDVCRLIYIKRFLNYIWDYLRLTI
jgi:hypothetical protein